MTIILNAAKLGTKEEAHSYLKSAFEFPEYYGNNLDALADCLSELPAMRVLVCSAEDAGDYFEKVRRVLEDHTELVIL